MRKIGVFVLLCILAVYLCGCMPQTPVEKNKEKLKLIVVDSDDYLLLDENGNLRQSRIFYPQRDGSVSFDIDLGVGMFVDSVSNVNYKVDYTDIRKARVTIFEVTRSCRIEIKCSRATGVLIYDANGGSVVDSEKGWYVEPFDTTNHTRVNTSQGSKYLRKDKCTLIGWNTRPDGSGQSVGLGSRLSVGEDKSSVLYAQWRDWTANEYFSFQTTDDTATITDYFGNDDIVCVPAEIDGKPVTKIDSRAFRNVKADAIVLPDTVVTVEKDAFTACKFTTLYMYDNVEVISDDSFRLCNDFSTLRINAVQSPRYMTSDRHSNFADKYDILINNRDKIKTIVFGGSGAYFNVDAMLLEKEFCPDRQVINMAVNAHYNARAQFEMMLPYIGDGDIFVHIPEAASEQQFFMREDFGDVRLWQGVEANFDLFALVNIKGLYGTFDKFAEFNDARSNLPEQKYIDGVKYIDERGDYGAVVDGVFTTEKKAHGVNETISDEARIVTDFVEGDSAQKATTARESIYKKLENKGCKVFVSNAAVNLHGLLYNMFNVIHEKEITENMLMFCRRTEDRFDRGFAALSNYPILLKLSDCIYDGAEFYNSDYHLATSAAEDYTRKLGAALKQKLQ